MVALASAFVRVRPELDKPGFKKAGEEGGAAAGQSYGDGFKRGSDGRLRDSRGKFVKDSEAAGSAGGSKAGAAFGSTFGKGSSKAFDALKSNLKLAAGVFVPIGLGAAVAEIGKIGIAYEDNLNIFKAVSGATAKQMATVADKARALGADVKLPGVSAAGAAAAMTELAKAGFTVQQAMDAAQGTLQLARVAGIDEAQAAEVAANAVNAFGISAKDTTFVVDELAASANSSSIEITEASDAFKQAAAVFSGLQGSVVGGKEAITELNTAIAILGNNGIKGQDAGTSLKQALLSLTGASGPAKDAMKLLALNAGNASISQKNFNKVLTGGASGRRDALKEINKLNPGLKNQGDIAYTAAGKMRPLRDILGLVAAGTQGLSDEQKNLAITTIFGSDASRSILALLKGGVPVYDKQREAILKQGAAAEFAAAKNAGLGGAIDNVKSQFENAAIEVYNQVKGPLTEGLNTFAEALPGIFADIGKFAGFIHDNIGVIRDWAVAIGVVTAALKVNSTVMAIQAAGGILKWIQSIGIVTRVTQAWTAAQIALDAAMEANPIGLIIVAITALIAGLVLLFRHNETFRKIVLAVWGGIKTAISATVDWIVNTAWPAIKKAWDAIAAAALWLWHNVIEPVWHGIEAVIGFVVKVVKAYIEFVIGYFKAVAAVVLWLWHNIFEPAFAVIRKIIEIWWLAVQIVFKALSIVIRTVVGAAVEFLRAVFTAVFGFVKDKVITPWWETIKFVFNAFRTYVYGPIVAAIQYLKGVFERVLLAVGNTVIGWYQRYIAPIFAAVRRTWNDLALGFSIIYNQKIKPVFEAFIGFIKNTVVGGFKTGVSAITRAWSAVQEAAKKPVSFVVNHVINPFINGLNKVAGIVGVKDRVAPIKGFASGGKISGAGGISDNRQAVIPGVGAVQLQGGEFVVNRQDAAKALPLLRWVNAGMKGGAANVARYLGKPLAQYPGDGSEGWAFKSGGLIGWADDVWGAITDPVSTLKKPVNALLNQIPGSGLIRDFLIGSVRKIVDGTAQWLFGTVTGSAQGAVRAVRARAFVQSQAGKPYIWADAGPDGYDCSGIVSAAYNILHGRSPYSHTFSTESLPGQWFDTTKKLGTLMAGWSHPGQNPASATVGHMAGQIAGLPFESTGSTGVRIGDRARRVTAFANTGVARAGGGLIPDLLGKGIRLFDAGGFWPTDTLGVNLSGRTEYVDPTGRSGGMRNYYITNNVAPGGHPAEVGRQTVLAIQAFERGNGSGWRK